MKFQHVDPADPNIDIDVHPNPPGLWARVVVVGRWSSKERVRKAWPDASVVGPLRTLRGIDLLVRNLLANPQIRVIIVDGPDLRPDVTASLREVFSVGRDPITDEETNIDRLPTFLAESLFTTEAPLYKPVPGDPLFEAVCLMLRGVKLLTVEEWDTSGMGAEGNLAAHVEDRDRAGGASFLKPPKPPTLDVLPHGDPGHRVVGDTLAEVWPRALEQAMRFGRKAPTQYGETREVLALTSVVRNPTATLDEFMARLTRDIDTGEPVTLHDPHPVLGFTYQDVETYYRQLVGLDPKGERDYSYGSRMRGKGAKIPSHMPPGYVIGSVTDQIAAVEKLLAEKPDTRAAFLTPWRPDEDSGKESGRPCLDGVRFRAVDGALHMFVTFRSHDLYAGHPQNLAALCLWLIEEAKTLDMPVGTLTCTSWSAHVYARDYVAALDVVKANPAPMVQWDQRSSWRVRTKPGAPVEGLTCCVSLRTPGGLRVLCGKAAAGLDSITTSPVCAEHAPVNVGPWERVSYRVRRWPWGAIAGLVENTEFQGLRGVVMSPTSPGPVGVGLVGGDTEASARLKVDERLADMKTLPLPTTRVLVAEALTPGEEGGDSVIATFEAPSPGALRLAVIRSGLVTDVGAACWLGSEIERVWAGGNP